MTPSKIFRLFSLAFLWGIAAASFLYPGKIEMEVIWGLGGVAAVLFAVFWENKKMVAAGGAVFFLALGMGLTTGKLEKIEHLDFPGKNFSGLVQIIKEPQIKERRQEMEVVSLGQKIPGKIRVTVPGFPVFSYGDQLQVECQLEIPENRNPDFDWRMYLAKENVFYVCDNPEIEKTGENRGNFFLAALFKIKNKFNAQIFRSLPSPESGLLSGLLLGGDDYLSPETQEKFSRTGLSHILAVSGYNVTIIAEYLMLLGIFLGLWRRQAFWFAVSGIILFVIFVGGAASVVRAGVMGILLLWAVKNGRLANSGNALLFSASVMLIFNPLLLRYDVGFQLSFLAVAGIIFAYPFFNDRLVKKHRAFGMSEILFLTLSAQIFVLPVLLFNFGQLSLVSPLANLLVLPVIPLAMFLGFLAAVLGFLLPVFPQVFFIPAYILLRYETLVIDFLSSWKFASLEWKMSAAGVVFWYLGFLWFVFFVRMKKRYEKPENNL